MQFLSEPSCGSDVAGALMTAVRDGDEWVLNGSKVWTTGAWWSDWGLCLARTNWDVSKHSGLTVFIFPIKSPGIEVRRIEMLKRLKGVLSGVSDGCSRPGVGEALKRRIGQGIVTRTLSDQASAISRLFAGLADTRRATIAYDLAGGAGGTWVEDDGELGQWGIRLPDPTESHRGVCA